MKKDILIIKAGEAPEKASVELTLEDMQEIVGGNIEAIYFFDDPVAILCNEEGKINGLPLNRSLKDGQGQILDIICGTFFICGIDEEAANFAGLSNEMMEKYEKIFKSPESFMRLGNKIIVIPAEK